MSSQPAAASDAEVGPDGSDAAMVPHDGPDGSVGAAVLLGWLSLAWLTLLIVSVLSTLGSSTDGVLAVTETAYGLPAVIFAALIAGAGVGQAVRRLAHRWLGAAAVPRLFVALGCGASTGVGAAAAVVFGDGRGGSAVEILGWALFAGATVGGALTGLHRRAGLLTAAAAAGALAVAGTTTARELAKGPLLELFGAADTAGSVLAAQSRLVWVTALLAGALAGLVIFGYLHRAVRRSGRSLPWPGYLVAGAGPGLLLVIAEVVTRVGGAQLLDLARSFSESDQAFQTMADGARINSALIVLFTAAFTALICLGRTLPGQPAAEPAAGSEPAGDSEPAVGSAGIR
ncbi:MULTISPECIES: hypothetical protein [unclassified Solwaraspora]|uniref:hypothetical protein n=1 Tax=unclassified Solwaraspora TaxID=2627926 RepID=UPI00248D3635|nr:MULTISPECIES: hypothetical protein [unclassified Solwaraspora]WBB96130.1 hypothetical protein O7553_22700 [Solwaraspora sp. WMMA2059]WBC19965.1 hypothetical protein O7543_24675 [Solwaraspora sp. WMMA2080]WJK32438.1 hypothetical protein O7610_16825 [Solwaraspora sp. WMMA2065]